MPHSIVTDVASREYFGGIVRNAQRVTQIRGAALALRVQPGKVNPGRPVAVRRTARETGGGGERKRGSYASLTDSSEPERRIAVTGGCIAKATGNRSTERGIS